MSAPQRPLRIAIVSGEESGDLLGHDLVLALGRMTGRPVELVGVGGRHLQSLGLRPLFDPGDIALMGVSAVVKDLPRLVRRIGTTARAIAQARPDCLITIDSPAFTMRVAKRVRALAPRIPIVKYVCPSVWAWGPWRAKQMRAYVDRVLCILPFEVEVLQRLEGPQGIYVGHRLANDPALQHAATHQAERLRDLRRRHLLVLPGSRRAEVKGLLESFGETVALLSARGMDLSVAIPTVPHVEALVREGTRNWAIQPEVSVEPAQKQTWFGQADAALAASGTVLLELALARVPMISCYRSDPLMRMAMGLITTWSAALPNLITDRVVVPEYYDRFVRPGHLARHLEGLMSDGPARDWQLAGCDLVAERMALPRNASDVAAEAVLALISGDEPA